MRDEACIIITSGEGAPSKNPLVVRLGYVALNVTDTDCCADDAYNIDGARIRASNDRAVMLTSNQRRAELILIRADQNQLRPGFCCLSG